MVHKRKRVQDTGKHVHSTRHRAPLDQMEDDWPPVGAVQMGPYRATAGKYWLGDLSTVLSADLWQEIGGKQGNITLSDGRTVVLFKLPDGAGVYPGKDGNNHLIDSGTVGVTLLKGLCIEAQTTGQTIVYNKTFECLSVTVAHPQGGGMVSFNTFGHSVTIHSDDQVYSMKQFLSEGLAAQQHATRLRGR